MLDQPLSKSPLLRALQGETVAPPPIWLMRQAGRYLPEYRSVRERAGSFLALCNDPGLAAEVTLQPIRRFDFDAAIIFSDILVIPHALGQKLDFLDGEGPKLEPITDAAGIARLDATRADAALAPVYEALRLVRSELGRDKALIGFCGAPWTVATYMVAGGGSKDQAETRAFAYADRQVFEGLIDLLVDVSAEYLLGQVAAGADALQIFDSWAGSLPEDEFARWCIQPTARLIAKVREKAPATPIIGFPRGAGLLSLAYAKETGLDCIGCDTALPLDFIAGELQPLVPVQGNLDPVLLMTGGDRLERRVCEILDRLAPAPFIFNLGHGILPSTPAENVARLVSLVRSH